MTGPANRTRLSASLRFLWQWTVRCLAAIGFGTLIFLLGFDYSRMVSGSMSPTLQGEDWKDGDRVLSERFSYWFRAPRRWEVIAIQDRNGNRIMKRVVGLPGESIQMRRNGTVLIDGHEVKPPAELPLLDHHYLPYGNLMDGKPVRYGNAYYVLGDETKDSEDSRFNPAITPAQILGRAWIILGPAGRRGFVR
ncbi:MAG: signal peptidase I [Planctomycetes bacterium]|nr:signal peptidase I [Planctomycetota bacterium]